MYPDVSKEAQLQSFFTNLIACFDTAIKHPNEMRARAFDDNTSILMNTELLLRASGHLDDDQDIPYVQQITHLKHIQENVRVLGAKIRRMSPGEKKTAPFMALSREYRLAKDNMIRQHLTLCRLRSSVTRLAQRIGIEVTWDSSEAPEGNAELCYTIPDAMIDIKSNRKFFVKITLPELQKPAHDIEFPLPAFRAADIKQGFIGECFFDATLGAILTSNPLLINQILLPSDEPGFVNVRLFDEGEPAKPVTYKIETTIIGNRLPRQLAYNHSSHAIRLIQKAYALHRVRLSGEMPFFAEAGHKIVGVVDAIDKGYTSDVFAALTGKMAKKLAIPRPDNLLEEIYCERIKDDNTALAFLMLEMQVAIERYGREDKKEEFNQLLRRYDDKPAAFAYDFHTHNDMAPIKALLIKAASKKETRNKKLVRLTAKQMLALIHSAHGKLIQIQYKRIKTLLMLGGSLTTTTKEFSPDSGEARQGGVVGSHVYTIHAVERRGNTPYLLVQNPWKKTISIEDKDGKLHEITNAPFEALRGLHADNTYPAISMDTLDVSKGLSYIKLADWIAISDGIYYRENVNILLYSFSLFTNALLGLTKKLPDGSPIKEQLEILLKSALFTDGHAIVRNPLRALLVIVEQVSAIVPHELGENFYALEALVHYCAQVSPIISAAFKKQHDGWSVLEKSKAETAIRRLTQEFNAKLQILNTASLTELKEVLATHALFQCRDLRRSLDSAQDTHDLHQLYNLLHHLVRQSKRPHEHRATLVIVHRYLTAHYTKDKKWGHDENAGLAHVSSADLDIVKLDNEIASLQTEYDARQLEQVSNMQRQSVLAEMNCSIQDKLSQMDTIMRSRGSKAKYLALKKEVVETLRAIGEVAGSEDEKLDSDDISFEALRALAIATNKYVTVLLSGEMDALALRIDKISHTLTEKKAIKARLHSENTPRRGSLNAYALECARREAEVEDYLSARPTPARPSIKPRIGNSML